MDSLTHQQFDATVRQVLQDYNIPDIEEKLKKGELYLLLTTINNLFAYQTWTSPHVDSLLPKQAISSKNIDNFIKSLITHIDAVMDLYDFQYLDKCSYFRLYGIRFVLHIFSVNKKFLINKLHDIAFEYWCNPIHYKNSFELIRNSFLDIVDIEKYFNEQGSDFSDCKEDFARNFLNMQTFFYAFNVTEKRIKTSFSIQVYRVLSNLSLSKYKTKEITDTIMHHLDIDATINLRKIDKVQCIAKINLHSIYGYDDPVIPVKFLDRPLIKSIQKGKRQEALSTNNCELIETLDEMIECFSQSHCL